MTALTLAQASNIMLEVEAANPPPQVLRAVKTCVTLAAAGGSVPGDLINYVQSWMAKRGEQNRYGK